MLNKGCILYSPILKCFNDHIYCFAMLLLIYISTNKMTITTEIHPVHSSYEHTRNQKQLLKIETN